MFSAILSDILDIMANYNTIPVDEILRRIGNSLEEMRVESGLQDAEVVSRGGIKATTWANLKTGRNVTVSNLVKALEGLGRLSMLDALINYTAPVSPISLVEEPEVRPRKRIHKKQKDSVRTFHWGDEE